MQKIKKDDMVVVLVGRDKGRSGKVIKVLPKSRVLVEGVNMAKKHVKPNPNKGEQGGILEREAGIHVSNVAVLNPVTKKGDRVGIKRLEDGTKVRYFKSNDEVIDV
ncbi:50S ribosomal protein L24 [Candidiatus Paracoxiella cheracis]|uniref:50S ribosomal protein L24 n=1 Tax=Candidiatus Paracoxiella cheracis TaxID=3405120 RepID=UPI003BF594F7